MKKIGRRQAHSVTGDLTLILFLTLVGSFMVLPFIYSILQSLKPMEELFIFPPKFFVRNPTLGNFMDLFLRTNNMWVPFERYISNSIYISVLGTLLSVLVSSLGAYPLAKMKFKGRVVYEKIIVISLLFVHQVTAIPQYVIMSKLGMIDTMSALIFPAVASSLSIYLMKNFMSQLPDDLIEAAKVDGSSHLRTFAQIVMPNVKPAWITVVILTFQGLWNRGTGAYIYSEQLKNLPTLLTQISASSTVSTAGIAAAAAVFLMIPPVFVFVFSQNKIVETMAYSGIKG